MSYFYSIYIMAGPMCSVIIRSYNEQKHIRRLLEGIKRQVNADELQVILVDSGSTDHTVKIALEYNVQVINILPEDFSFGRALNLGCAAATGEFLLFASAHVYPVYTNWISKMIMPFKDEKIALVYGRQIGNQFTKYSEHQLFNKWFPPVSNYNQVIPFCNNANCVVRKKLWEQQPFDEILTGLEDLDWASKIKNKGYHVAYEAQASIVHVHEETPSRIKNRYFREAIALKKIYPREQFSFQKFLRLTIANISSDGYHAMHDGQFFKNFGSIIIFRLMQFWGTYLGYHNKSIPHETLAKRLYYPQALNRNLSNDLDRKNEGESAEVIIYSGFEGEN